MSLQLARFKVVLVGTKTPENIGSVARLLENYAVAECVLVQPNCEWREGVAQWIATNSARDRLNALPVMNSLAEAVQDCSAVVGFTVREGRNRRPNLKLETLSKDLPGKVALVFGREDYCLFAEEIELCTHLCGLDSSPDFPSLNLSHSVAVVLSHLFTQENDSRRGHHELASQESVEPMFDQLKQVMIDLGMVGEGNPDRVHAKLKKILQRSLLKKEDVSVLRGFFTRIQHSVQSKKGE